MCINTHMYVLLVGILYYQCYLYFVFQEQNESLSQDVFNGNIYVCGGINEYMKWLNLNYICMHTQPVANMWK